MLNHAGEEQPVELRAFGLGQGGHLLGGEHARHQRHTRHVVRMVVRRGRGFAAFGQPVFHELDFVALRDGDALAEGQQVFAFTPGPQEIHHLNGLGVVVNHALHERDVRLGDFGALPGGGRRRGKGPGRLARRARLHDGSGLARRFRRPAEHRGCAQNEEEGDNGPNSHASLYDLRICGVNRTVSAARRNTGGRFNSEFTVSFYTYSMFLPLLAAVLPLLFEPNWGQGPADARFVGRTAKQTAVGIAAGGVRMAGVSYELVGARRSVGGRLERPLGSRSHYYLGSLRIEGVPHYERLRFTEVYPGTDVVYYSRAGQLEYDFLLQAGADAGRIRMRFEAAPELLTNGDLRLADGVKLEKPRAFQEGKEVAARFRVDGREVGFVLGAYDRTKPLRIDPVLVYSVSTGGTAITADTSGNAYVAGGATSPVGFSQDAFVAKLSPSGQLVWSAYLGGVRSDTATSVALDASGHVYVAGETSSNDFPPQAENPTLGPAPPWVFAARFAPDGTLAMSTVLVRDRLSAPLVGVHSASGAVFVYGPRSAQNQLSAAVVKLTAADRKSFV